MNIYDLAETWFSEYHTIMNKVKSPTVSSKTSKAKKKAINLKGRKLNEHAYLWGQHNKKTTKEVCQEFNINVDRLRSWIRDNNLIPLKSGKIDQTGTIVHHRPRAEVKALCEQAYDKMKNHGWCQTKACAEYKISNLTIQRYIKKLNENS
jgi:hypothetical protein